MDQRKLAEPPPRETVSQAERQRLRYEKAEAKARYAEGLRLAEYRDKGHGVTLVTPEQAGVLRQWDAGALRTQLNAAVAAHGHGRLRKASGAYLDIGGSTGGGPRRIIDGWQPPDWCHFLQDE